MSWAKKSLYLLIALFVFCFVFLYTYPSLVQEIRRDRLRFIYSQKQNSTELTLCPEMPPNLGPVLVNTKEEVSFLHIISENPNVTFGGRGAPQLCKALQKIAIIIPYRDRQSHLKIWLHYMHPFLQKQQGDYGVYVVEQTEDSTFNKARLMNVGFKEASKEYGYDCFIFNDVDIIPMDERNLYRCSQNPTHMSNALDRHNFRLYYPTAFGGIVAMKKEQFLKVNGFSNLYWGWGQEDDDLYNRVVAAGMKIERPNPNISRATVLLHTRDHGNEKNKNGLYLLQSSAKRMYEDGLNTLKYEVVSRTKHRLFSKITVNIGSPHSDSKF